MLYFVAFPHSVHVLKHTGAPVVHNQLKRFRVFLRIESRRGREEVRGNLCFIEVFDIESGSVLYLLKMVFILTTLQY